MVFGTLVDHHRKHTVMVVSSIGTLAAFLLGGLLFLLVPGGSLLDLGQPWFWLFTVVILAGAVVEQLRSVALSTTVTLLVPGERRANANGLVGTVQGLAFLVTSVFSGLAIGFLGMGWTILIAVVLVTLSLVHLLTLRIPEPEIAHDPERRAVDFRGGWRAIRAVPGLLALIIFTTFNNLTGGVFMALMDPYGLELFSPQLWGIVLGVTSTGFLIGGAVIAKFGLGNNPIRTMLIMVMLTGALGALFTVRENWLLYAGGIWIFMMLMPAVEAAEQTIIQRVVPFRTQGRVFGLAMTFEAGAAPITSFLVAPIAEFFVIPYMQSDAGHDRWGWLLGEGTTRGIALCFLVAGLVSILLGAGALLTKSYRVLSRQYAEVAAGDTGQTEGAAEAVTGIEPVSDAFPRERLIPPTERAAED